MADTLRARIAEVLNTTPAGFVQAEPDGAADHARHEWHRHDRHRYNATCALCRGEEDTLTDAVLAVIQPELNRLRTEAEEDRRALIDQPVLRHCVYPRCLREFDASAALSGRSTRESWSSKGWFQVRVLDGYICPEHVGVVAEDAHRPQWRHGEGPSVLVCACAWESVPVRWRKYGTEAWKDHVLTITEETPR